MANSKSELHDELQNVSQDVQRVAGAIWADIFPHRGRTLEQFQAIKRAPGIVHDQDYAPVETRLTEVTETRDVEVGDLLMVFTADGQSMRQYGQVRAQAKPWMSAREIVTTCYGYALNLVVGKTAKRLKVVPVQIPGKGWTVTLGNLKYSSAYMNEPTTMDPSAAKYQVVLLGKYSELVAKMVAHPSFDAWQGMFARASRLSDLYNDVLAEERAAQESEIAPKKRAMETINRLAGETLVELWCGRVSMVRWLDGNAKRLQVYLTGLMTTRDISLSESLELNEALRVLGWSE